MCGILGIVSTVPISNKESLKSGLDAIRHRGPDDFGVWWSNDQRVGFGHRRLAIIDISPAGHQPMKDLSGKLNIIFNGEIYNFLDLRKELMGKGYSFRSHSDTEVIMAAYTEWGTDCLSRLNGMFAFALYDEPEKKIFFARDRAGEKPLFYSLQDGILRFGSELKGIMADPSFKRIIEPNALDCYLSMGYVPGNQCILQNTNKLPPAHAMIFDLETGKLKLWCYWQVPEFEAGQKHDENELIDELQSLLDDSVRRQLIADVPVGVLLSGGVDSSLVTAMAVRHVSKVQTFTVSFPGHSKYDESSHAQLIAKYFDTEHTELEASDVSVDLLPKLAKQFDEPIVDSSMIPTYLVCQLIRKHCTVALGGDGGDELFGGYGHHNRLLWMDQKLGKIPLGFRKLTAKFAKNFLPVGFKGRVWLQSLGEDLKNSLPLIATQFESSTRKVLMSSQGNWETVAEMIREKKIPVTNDLLQRVTRMDFMTYLPEDILVKVDRSSMLNSLEVRAPLLDYRIIEFAYGKVPSELKTSPTDRKIILKKLTGRLLPPEFDKQRKQGFGIPIGPWIQESPIWQSFFKEHLLNGNDSIFDRNLVSKLLDGHINGRINTERLFGLLMFELWRKEYRVSI